MPIVSRITQEIFARNPGLEVLMVLLFPGFSYAEGAGGGDVAIETVTVHSGV